MKKYRSTFIFIGSCLLITVIILLINSNLSRILPTYKDIFVHQEGKHTENDNAPDGSGYDDSQRLLTVKERVGFFSGQTNQFSETAQETMARADQPVPQAILNLLEHMGYKTVVSASARKSIDERRYFSFLVELRKSNLVRTATLIYTEDETEIYFYTTNSLNTVYTETYATDYDEQQIERITMVCKQICEPIPLLSEWLDGFHPVLAVSPQDPELDDAYLLQDHLNQITVEYNARANEIIAFSIQK